VDGVARRAGLFIAAGILIGLASAVEALAQTLSNFTDLPLRVNLGDSVRVSGVDGQSWRGRVLEMTPDRLVLRVTSPADGQGTVTVGSDRVRQVSVVGDSIRNGAAIGLASGAALGLVGHYTVWERTAASPIVHVLLLGSLGAGVGAIADAVFSREAVVFRASRVTARIAVLPTGTIQLAMRW
jgi:hypothetical protein